MVSRTHFIEKFFGLLGSLSDSLISFASLLSLRDWQLHGSVNMADWDWAFTYSHCRLLLRSISLRLWNVCFLLFLNNLIFCFCTSHSQLCNYTHGHWYSTNGHPAVKISFSHFQMGDLLGNPATPGVTPKRWLKRKLYCIIYFLLIIAIDPYF